MTTPSPDAARQPLEPSRREFLRAVPATAWLGGLVAGQAPPPAIRTRALNHFTLSVSDVNRSLGFYQGLFGLPVQARQGGVLCLRVGRGPQFIALSAVAAGVAPHINHFCVTVDDFDVDRLFARLAAHGVTKADGAGLSGGAMRARLRRRGPEAGGAAGGTPQLYLGDPGGVVVQLQATTYCGGAGALGEVCSAAEPAATAGLLKSVDLSHVTMRTPEPAKVERFYQQLFGMSVLAHQGKTPALRVGDGPQFLMMSSTGAGANVTGTASRGYIHHACLTVEGFDVDRVFKVLNDYGLKPRGDGGGDPPPLVYYVSMRMPERGGAPGGTPELYFTDPDGLIIQLQDPRYCGGGGRLGEVCG